MISRALSSVSPVKRTGPVRNSMNRIRSVFDSIRRMSFSKFFKTFSSELPYNNMVSDMYASFEGILEVGELAQVYSRWEAPNEINYLDSLNEISTRGGVYLGVATEPVNFTYIAKVRPELAVLVDINPAVSRIHLPLKGALMEIAETRLEFLSYVLGRPLAGQAIPQFKTPQDYYNFFAKTPESKSFREQIWQRISHRLDPEVRSEAYQIWMDNFGIEADKGQTAADALLGKYLYWNMGVTDQAGRHTAWLASEKDYSYIRDLWLAGRIKGVTGDLSGGVMRNLAGLVEKIDQEISCMYISNCEDPLEINGRLMAFKRVIKALPWKFGAQIVKYDFGAGQGNAFNIRKVGLGEYQEQALKGLSETIAPDYFAAA